MQRRPHRHTRVAIDGVATLPENPVRIGNESDEPDAAVDAFRKAFWRNFNPRPRRPVDASSVPSENRGSMSNSAPHDPMESALVANAILRQMAADLAGGSLLPLEHYERRWPNHRGLVAREYAGMYQGRTEVLETAGRPPPFSPAVEPRRIGGYKIERLLGDGGQGRVYLAFDPNLRRRVAVKVLGIGANVSRQAYLRFLREAEMASRLDHPCICGVHEVGEDEGSPFIVMPYIDGQPLSHILAARHDRLARDDSATSVSLPSRDESGTDPTPADRESERTTPRTRREIMMLVRMIEELPTCRPNRSWGSAESTAGPTSIRSESPSTSV